MSFLEQSLLEARSEAFQAFRFDYEIRVVLEELWGPEPESHVERVSEVASYSYEISFSVAKPEPLPWSIAFTPTFRKAISVVDRKLQGRVLSALTELSEKPTMAHGDTRKPLTGELKGLWRYRFGDYRLVYEPREEKRIVVLLDFDARGGVYEN
jgi:mRNA-degrading endonuclease RelE of RelBE toxin-antitoxin system